MHQMFLIIYTLNDPIYVILAMACKITVSKVSYPKDLTHHTVRCICKSYGSYMPLWIICVFSFFVLTLV